MQAVRLVQQGWSKRKVGRHLGFHHTAVSRWCARAPGHKQIIPTRSSRPKSSPKALDQKIVSAIKRARKKHNRCAVIVHQELLNLGIPVSLSSVKRTIKREGLHRPRSPWKRYHQTSPRPLVEHPGDLVEVDTVHFQTIDRVRFYLYTAIDVYSRWAYARVYTRATTHASVDFIRRARKEALFQFKMLQSDHGSEFSIWFTEQLGVQSITHRHSRVRQPNDNAHIERFNRSIQEECLNDIHPRNPKTYQRAVSDYLSYYNNQRLHLGIDNITPSEKLLMVPRS
jgi:transposase InsO family protein